MDYKERLAAAKAKQVLTERKGVEAGRRSRDAAIDAVAGPAEDWIAVVVGYVRGLPSGYVFTTDYLWKFVDAPPEPRAMGAVMRDAAALGLIEATGDYQRSARSKCHARPLAVWRRL